mmetsp:Transcript_13577/g.13323  ORF Transcript_13577/g.13323 Transcript_13577/m.13323 type:complete len:89 (+) Transcript_13577:1491-1757(+)
MLESMKDEEYYKKKSIIQNNISGFNSIQSMDNQGEQAMQLINTSLNRTNEERLPMDMGKSQKKENLEKMKDLQDQYKHKYNSSISKNQ